MSCYLCCTQKCQDICKCLNPKCSAKFHKNCWIKYLDTSKSYESICKVCLSGFVPITSRYIRPTRLQRKIHRNDAQLYQSTECQVDHCGFLDFLKIMFAIS